MAFGLSCVGIFPERVFRELLGIKLAISKVEGFSLMVDLEKDCAVLLKVATESEDAAVFLASNVSAGTKGFFPLAYALMDAFPASEPVRSILATASLYQTGNAGSWDNYEQALAAIESEINNAATTPHHRDWLKGIKQQIEQRRRLKRPRNRGDDYLGWS